MANPFVRQTPMSERHFLPMVPQPPKIDANWKCQQSGDCCSIPKTVVMTVEEKIKLQFAAPKEIRLEFTPVEGQPNFVEMTAGPCPLFVFGGCLVYSVRPYNCRRFACMRPDVKSEPFDPERNVIDRVRYSRVARRMAQGIQRKAQRWARNHGWAEGQ